MKKFYSGFCKVEEVLCNLGFAVMVALVFISSIARSIGSPLAWSIDIAQLLLCWTTLIGADVAFRHERFEGLDLVTRHFPEKTRKAIAIAMDVIIIIALIILFAWGIKLCINSRMRTFQTLKMSYSWVVVALPVMACFMSVSVGIDIKKILNGTKGKSAQELKGGNTQ